MAHMQKVKRYDFCGTSQIMSDFKHVFINLEAGNTFLSLSEGTNIKFLLVYGFTHSLFSLFVSSC